MSYIQAKSRVIERMYRGIIAHHTVNILTLTKGDIHNGFKKLRPIGFKSKSPYPQDWSELYTFIMEVTPLTNPGPSTPINEMRIGLFFSKCVKGRLSKKEMNIYLDEGLNEGLLYEVDTNFIDGLKKVCLDMIEEERPLLDWNTLINSVDLDDLLYEEDIEELDLGNNEDFEEIELIEKDWLAL